MRNKEGLIWHDDEQPQATYPEMPLPDEDLNKICRACNNGYGDGICNYHRSQFDRIHKRQKALWRRS